MTNTLNELITHSQAQNQLVEFWSLAVVVALTSIFFVYAMWVLNIKDRTQLEKDLARLKRYDKHSGRIGCKERRDRAGKSNNPIHN